MACSIHSQPSYKVRTLVAKRHPSKGVENYFPDAMIYHDSLEVYPLPEELDTDNEAYTEPKPGEERLWELDFSLLGLDKTDVNDTTEDEGKWYIN